jgi:hypothetical protein
MMTMIILICMAAGPCDDAHAEDRLVIRQVPIAACALAGQTVIAAQPGERAVSRMIKIVCRSRP